jgi:hypothetical protein
MNGEKIVTIHVHGPSRSQMDADKNRELTLHAEPKSASTEKS